MAVSTRIIIALAAALLMAATAVVVTSAEESDAAFSSSYLSNPEAEIYTDQSSDLRGLAYLSDELPTTLSASSWVRSDGLWYNVNASANNVSHGRILTYGDAGITDVEVIKADVSAYFPCFTDSFQILQLEYTVLKDCSFIVSVTHSGMADFTDSVTEKISTLEDYYSEGRQNVSLYTICATGDLSPSEIRGSYHIQLTCDGQTATWDTRVNGAELSLKGTVCDADSTPISGARVYYTAGNTSDSVYTVSDGTYSIPATYGSVVTVTKIAHEKYTFESVSGGLYTYEEVTEDVSAGPTLHAIENTAIVTVKDQSGNPISGITVKAEWLFEIGSGSYYNVWANTIDLNFVTDDNGKANVLYTVPTEEAAKTFLYVYIVTDGTSFTADVNEPAHVGVQSEGLPAAPTGDGNAYADLTDLANSATLKVNESSIAVTVKGSGSSAPISGVSLSLAWYLQYASGGNYTISKVEATAWVGDVTDASGTVRAYYIAPTGEASYSFYLVVSGLQLLGSDTPNSMFTFDVVSLKSGSSSLTEQMSKYPGSVAILSTSMADATVCAKEVAYKVKYSMTGEDGDASNLPSSVLVSYSVNSKEGTSFNVERGASSIDFEITVMAGKSLSLSVYTDERSLTVSSWTFRSADSDRVIDSVASRFSTEIDRSVPVSAGDAVTISGVKAGDTISFSYVAGGSDIVRTFNGTSSDLSFQPLTVSGEIASDYALVCDDSKYCVISSGSASYTVAKLVSKEIVVYCSNLPLSNETADSVRSGMTVSVYYGDTAISSVTTDSSGMATVGVPDLSGVTYRYESYLLTGVEVTDDGFFKGCLSFNLHGIIDVDTDTYVAITLSYTASSNDGSVKEIITPTAGTKNYKVGTSQTFVASSMKGGFSFAGWYLGGQCVSSSNSYTVTITDDMDGQSLVGAYSVYEEEEETPLDMTAVAVGLVAIVIAILAFAYVLVQSRRY